ncbi:MAG: hypothetical protein HY520_01750 [Candidatus Aenigmarchaeota archaeon]|nr:hypothetical protein [Candidatus Aenigmarchaeota archaeon]
MADELKRLGTEALRLKAALLHSKNLDILLYLAKYNPEVSTRDIIDKFGKESLEGLKSLKESRLVVEEDGKLMLTEEGIFQVEGLLALAV